MKFWWNYILAIAIIAIVFINKSAFIEPMESKPEEPILNIEDDSKIMYIQTEDLSRDKYDCYLINLEKNKDRLATFSQYYNSSDLNSEPFVKIKAIYGRDINYTSFISPNVELNMTPGMVGCFLSHLDVYKKIIDGNKDYALIFEDDARMIRNIQRSIIQIIPQIMPVDWDIVLLGYDVSNPVLHKTVQYNTYKKMYGFYGTHSYLITKAGVKKMLNMTQIPFKNQIDHEMGELCERKLLNVYGITNPVVWQEARFTDVQTNPE
jgi:glycosyl transferase family 25